MNLPKVVIAHISHCHMFQLSVVAVFVAGMPCAACFAEMWHMHEIA